MFFISFCCLRFSLSSFSCFLSWPSRETGGGGPRKRAKRKKQLNPQKQYEKKRRPWAPCSSASKWSAPNCKAKTAPHIRVLDLATLTGVGTRITWHAQRTKRKNGKRWDTQSLQFTRQKSRRAGGAKKEHAPNNVTGEIEITSPVAW